MNDCFLNQNCVAAPKALSCHFFSSCDIHLPTGQEVATLIDNIEGAGFKSARWDASGLASGMYLYRLQAVSTTDGSRNFTQVKKVLLVR